MQATSKIILGTVQFGIPYGINNKAGMPAQGEVFRILDLAYANGVRTLDTAEAYGNAESIISAYHTKGPEQFLPISKFIYQPGFDLAESANAKIKALGVSSLYSYMLHSYSDFENYPLLAEEQFRLKSLGLISKTGISVYTNAELEHVLKSDAFDLVQLPFNLLDNFSQRGSLLQEARRLNKEVHVRSVFLQGLFFMTPTGLPPRLRPLAKYLSRLQEIADRHQLTVYELALNYALENPFIDKVLIGVDTTAQLQQNLQAVQRGLPAGVREQIDDIHVNEAHLLNPVNW